MTAGIQTPAATAEIEAATPAPTIASRETAQPIGAPAAERRSGPMLPLAAIVGIALLIACLGGALMLMEAHRPQDGVLHAAPAPEHDAWSPATPSSLSAAAAKTDRRPLVRVAYAG